MDVRNTYRQIHAFLLCWGLAQLRHRQALRHPAVSSPAISDSQSLTLLRHYCAGRIVSTEFMGMLSGAIGSLNARRTTGTAEPLAPIRRPPLVDRQAFYAQITGWISNAGLTRTSGEGQTMSILTTDY